MSLNTAFREAEDIKRLQKVIEKRVEEIGRPLRIMEFCGGHTHTIVKYGIDQLLEDYVIFVHGPGCPVCVLPISRVDLAIELARKDNVILCTYGDVLRVPGSQRKSLMDIRAEGRDVRMVYSCLPCPPHGKGPVGPHITRIVVLYRRKDANSPLLFTFEYGPI